MAVEHVIDGDDLHDRAVVSLQQAERLGTVEDLLIDLPEHRVGGLMLQGGLFRGGPRIRWSALHAVGNDALTIDDSRAIADDEHQLATLTRLSALRGLKVVTDSGDLAGTISGLQFAVADGAITHYVVTEPHGGLLQAPVQFLLPPTAVLAVGPELMTVDTSAVAAQQDDPT